MATTENDSTNSAHIDTIRSLVTRDWENIIAELDALARIPSISWPRFDQSQLDRSAEFIADAARRMDFFDVVNIVREPTSDGSLGQPAVIARREPRNGASTVLLYAHHDVQPPGDTSIWESKPFEPERRGDRLFGRGVADDKAGVVTHLQSLRILRELTENSLDTGIVLFIEGEEEYGSPSFTATLEAQRDLLQADTIIVADSGNWSTEVPALTVSLRGNAVVRVTVRTLDHALHSGMFGGVVPDAMMSMVTLLATLYTPSGGVAVDGLHVRPGTTPKYDEAQLRLESGLLDQVQPIGGGVQPTDFLAKLWNEPSVTVIGIDAPSTAEASNTLLPHVTAALSLRVAPGQDSRAAADALVRHLKAHAPFGAVVECEIASVGAAFSMDTDSQDAVRMMNSLREVWGVEPVEMGVGGSIPFIADFVDAFPGARVLVTGVEDPDTRAHSPNESLHLPSFERGIITETHFLLSQARDN